MAATDFWGSPAGWTLLTVGQIVAVLVWILLSPRLFAACRPQDLGVGDDAQGPQRRRAVRHVPVLRGLPEVRAQGGSSSPPGPTRTVFLMAPLVSFILAFGAWAVIPLAPGWVVSNINVGVLYLFAVSSLGVYGIIMGGWASNSKYPFLGALRSAAQMVSYEVSIGFVIVTVILLTGSLNLGVIVAPSGRLVLALERAGRREPGRPAGGPGDDPDVRHLLRFRPGRDQPAAVRPVRGGVRTRRRLSGGIFLDAVPPFS